MKLFGALSILLGSLLAALSVLREDGRRLRLLRELRQALRLLRIELDEQQTALPAAFRRLAERMGSGAAGGFFTALAQSMERLGEESFSALWRAAVSEKLAALEAEDRDKLASLGDLLGGSELAFQCAALEKCASDFESRAAQCAAQAAQRRRMTLTLALSFGGFVVIILL